MELPALDDCLDSFYDPGPPPPALSPAPVAPPDALLRELDEPGYEIGGRSLAEVLRPAYEAMTTAARDRLENLVGEAG